MKSEKRKKSGVKNLEETVVKSADAPDANSSSDSLAKQIKDACEGLSYISETDAAIFPFRGNAAAAVNREEVLKQTGGKSDAPVEERDFADFFAQLTEIKDWYGDEEKDTAQKFNYLKEALENNLRDLKVYKIGKVELNVYVLGLDEENNLLGIKTKAVETG